MAVKGFKFASPGIFLNEVDQSQLPKTPAPVGPIIIGRAQRGPSMRPVTVSSYEEFVQTFGEPIAGGDSSGDVWRSGVPAGPTYGPYAAQAWLANNPTVTYVRLLGVQSETATGTTSNSGKAGWTISAASELADEGPYGLYVFPRLAGATSSATDLFTPNNPANNDTLFTVIVPTEIGGQNITLTFKASTAAGALPIPAATEVFVKKGATDGDTATNLISAFNGINDNTLVRYGAGINGTPTQNGILGLTASAGSVAAKVSLFAKYPGIKGNDVAIGAGTNPATFVISPVAPTTLLGGTGENILTSSFASVTGALAAIWYCKGSVPSLYGYATDRTNLATITTGKVTKFINSNSDGTFSVKMQGTTGIDAGSIKKFDLSPTSGKFIRKVFNTNPQNTNIGGTSGLNSSDTNAYGYWLGETFENDWASQLAVTGTAYAGTTYTGIIVPLSSLNNRLGHEAEGDYTARTGWIIGQDLTPGVNTNYSPTTSTKLFRFIALDGGDWIRNNLKVTIDNITPPQNEAQKYGKFDVEVRLINDTDANKKIVESFVGCDLDPSSPDYIGKKIGNYEYYWNDQERRLFQKGDYPNNSKYIRVEIPTTIANGGTPFVPFGVLGPLKYKNVSLSGVLNNTIIPLDTNSGILKSWLNSPVAYGQQSNALNGAGYSFAFPTLRQRISSSEDSLPKYTIADWGASTTRAASSILYNDGVNDLLRVPTTGSAEFASGVAGTNLQYAWAFSLDDVRVTGSSLSGSTWLSKFYVYTSGSKAAGTSYTALSGTYKDLLNDGVNSFTTVFQGGSDGFNIVEGEPLRNSLLDSNSTNDNNYVYYTYRRAIDTIADGEEHEGNILSSPGLVFEPLTNYMIQVAESRGDILAVIDPSGEESNKATYVTQYEQSENNRGTTDRSVGVDTTVNTIRGRNLNSSYGTTYYPWVQISDSNSGKIVTIPPSIPAIGAMSYTDAIQAPWFAPSGFNRGGLSTGNAGVNVVNVTRKLNQADRDKLYPVNINPIASFPNEGIVVFGQKTLQATPSALDRINVRRLMLYIKRGIRLISARILFEPNVQDTWNNFKDQAEPFLASVKARFGLTDYKLILDTSTTTPDLIDQNIMYAKIYLKPARAIEFIAVDFFITRTGAQFPA